MIYQNKDVYLGTWCDNRRYKGKMTYIKQDVYDGSWYTTNENGYQTGTLTKANGTEIRFFL